MTNITISTDVLKAALVCASTEQVRYYLNGVYVDPKGFLVATDGHRLFCAKIDLEGVAPFDGWIIPAAAIKRALTGNKAPTIDLSPARLGDVAYEPIDAQYPDWRRVLPDDDLSGATAQFNPSYIADFGKIGDILAGKKKGSILPCQVHHNGDGPAGITFSANDACFGVLMPIRSSYANTADAACGWSNRRRMALA